MNLSISFFIVSNIKLVDSNFYKPTFQMKCSSNPDLHYPYLTLDKLTRYVTSSSYRKHNSIEHNE